MIKLDDILSANLFADMQAAGYVRQQTHPTLPYAILNYTEKAAYERIWNDVTRQCRGLIYDVNTREVLARPFPKFFNYGQTEAPPVDLYATAIVTDKMDGSLGIIYPTPGGYAVATRGSFASEQAIHATALLRALYPDYRPPVGATMLVEIIYPENRIVVDYGRQDDLVLLGAVDIASGRSVGPRLASISGWPGPVVEKFWHDTLAETLAAEPRPGKEGFVVWFPSTDTRVKIKYPDYVALHRIVTGLNARTVWEHLVSGRPLVELIEPLPDEFHPWVREIAQEILDKVNAEQRDLISQFQTLVSGLAGSATGGQPLFGRENRKAFAFAVDPVNNPDAWAMFALLDGRDIRPELLKRARPEPGITPAGRVYGEDTA